MAPSMASLGSSPIRGAALALASHHGRAHSRRVECIDGATCVEEEEQQHWVIVWLKKRRTSVG